ncbi:putative ribonuclease H-like domain-containing protein [Tanacetum coccineum]
MMLKVHFLCTIEEEVYVHQPLGFIDPAHPNKVYKVIKALYGLHQAPRAWYETLSSFLLENGFRRGTIDKTLFIKKNKSDIMLVQVKQQPDGIFISQDKYVADILKKFDFCSIKTATTPIESNKPLVKDEDGVEVDVHEYRSMIWFPDVFDCIKARHHVCCLCLCKEPALTGNQQLVDVNFLVEDSYLGSAKSRQLWQILLHRCQNMVAAAHCGWARQLWIQVKAQYNQLSPITHLSYEAPLPEGNTSGSAEDSMQLKELIDIIPKLVFRIETLGTELQQTKTTYGKAVLTLVKRVKILEKSLKRKTQKVV